MESIPAPSSRWLHTFLTFLSSSSLNGRLKTVLWKPFNSSSHSSSARRQIRAVAKPKTPWIVIQVPSTPTIAVQIAELEHPSKGMLRCRCQLVPSGHRANMNA